jgi:phosphoribosylformylglycinamidine cyclo-ligase
MEPTRIHTPDVLALVELLGPALRAACHVTGGGLPGNLPRVLPESLGADVRQDSWQMPEVFRWLADRGPIGIDELRRTFNCGIGMVLVIDQARVEESLDALYARGVEAWELGHVREHDATEGRVRYLG